MSLRQRILQSSLLLLIGNLAVAVRAADWPTYQQNNRRNAHTNEQLDVNQLVVQWKWTSAALPDPAWSGPAKWARCWAQSGQMAWTQAQMGQMGPNGSRAEPGCGHLDIADTSPDLPASVCE